MGDERERSTRSFGSISDGSVWVSRDMSQLIMSSSRSLRLKLDAPMEVGRQ